MSIILLLFQVWLVEVRIFYRMQSPWRRLCFRCNRIVHDAINGGPCAFSFSINPADHLCFDTLLQYIFVLFSMIEKIGDCCSVISTAFFHLHCFPRYPIVNMQIRMDIMCLSIVRRYLCSNFICKKHLNVVAESYILFPTRHHSFLWFCCWLALTVYIIYAVVSCFFVHFVSFAQL